MTSTFEPGRSLTDKFSSRHVGRGGEGNKTTIGEDGRESSRSPARKGGPQGGRRRSSMKDKAQEMFGLGRGEKEKRQGDSAVAIEDD